MEKNLDHHTVTLSESPFGKIERRFDDYHIGMQNIRLRFTREEFTSLSNLLKRAEEKEDEAFLLSL